MKKTLKIILITLGILLIIIIIDSAQALIFNNNPIIGLKMYCMKKEGILVTTYHCDNNKNITKLKVFNHSCDSKTICDMKLTNELETTITDNFKMISKTSDLSSSNPYDYVNNEYYKNIISLGEEAVPVLIDMYNKNELSGLDAYISALMVEDITNCSLRDKYNLVWSNAEEFYTLWKNNNCGFNK